MVDFQQTSLGMRVRNDTSIPFRELFHLAPRGKNENEALYNPGLTSMPYHRRWKFYLTHGIQRNVTIEHFWEPIRKDGE
jgi:hypothetical protein